MTRFSSLGENILPDIFEIVGMRVHECRRHWTSHTFSAGAGGDSFAAGEGQSGGERRIEIDTEREKGIYTHIYIYIKDQEQRVDSFEDIFLSRLYSHPNLALRVENFTFPILSPSSRLKYRASNSYDRRGGKRKRRGAGIFRRLHPWRNF